MPTSPWRKLCRKLSLPPIPDDLLQQAFQHGSYVREHGLEPLATNQRLEFLGDAVLDVIVAEELYRQHPEVGEGALTRRKATIVRSRSLAEAAQIMGLGEYLLLGRGEEDSGGRDKSSLLAEAVEALIGAIYLAAGLDATREFILKHVFRSDASLSEMPIDNKSRLQELIQSYARRAPQYVIIETSGPPHATIFKAEVRSGNLTLGHGIGTSKREAEQQAAAEALVKAQEWLPELTRKG